MKAGESLVLDSCTVIAHFKRDKKARRLIENAAELYLPLAAYGELYYERSNQKSANSALRNSKPFLKFSR